MNASGYEGGSCDYGRISHFSVIAKNARHIQKAVNFARKHNIRLAIKNTGHDGSRSAAPDSLQILTNRLKDISFDEHFRPFGGPRKVDYGPVVNFGAGVMGGELYKAGAAHGYSIVGGECSTVGTAGGYIQGGGFSPALSPMRGLGVDQVVEMEVVTANVGANSMLLVTFAYNNRVTLSLPTNSTTRISSGHFVAEEAGRSALSRV